VVSTSDWSVPVRPLLCYPERNLNAHPLSHRPTSSILLAAGEHGDGNALNAASLLGSDLLVGLQPVLPAPIVGAQVLALACVEIERGAALRVRLGTFGEDARVVGGPPSGSGDAGDWHSGFVNNPELVGGERL